MDERCVLIIEDEQAIIDILKFNFKKEGYKVLEAMDGQTGLELALSENPDLILLDVMLPKMDGFEVCKKIREKSSVPVIMLTARSEEFDILTGYENGADDYVTKPFSPGVLVKRVEALLRRASAQTKVKTEREVSELFFNDEAHEVRLEGKEVDLTLKEYQILKKFLESPGRVFSREQLLDSIWGFDFSGDVRTVDSHVARLRTKLGAWGNKHLKTVYGIGYKIEEC
jgi:two-component system response regulator VicR